MAKRSHSCGWCGRSHLVMTRTSWQFPMKCRFSVQHSGGYKPSLLGVSRGRVPAWVCVILSRFATSWSVNLPTRLAGVILRFYLLIWVLLFHYIGENTGSNGKAYRTDRQTDRQVYRRTSQLQLPKGLRRAPAVALE